MAISEEQATPNGFPDAEEILSEAQVNTGLDHLAHSLQSYIDTADCILLGVLTGGMFPLQRLCERLRGNYRVDFCHATRYAGATTGGDLQWLARPHLDPTGATVIVIDDIYDAGITLTKVAAACAQQGADRVLTAALFVKNCEHSPDARPPDLDAGLRVPDRYVFGCGMDLFERWRHLPAVYALNSST